MPDFSFVKEIDPNNKYSWRGKLFITIDIDWCHDDLIEDTINLISKYKVKSTWFATHLSPKVKDLLKNPEVEIGIHPNFNKILNGDYSEEKNYIEVIDNYLKINPLSKSIRSHSLTNNEKLLSQFANKKLTHICNHFIPYSSRVSIKPYKLWDNLIVIPHCWQDNVSLLMENKLPLSINKIFGSFLLKSATL